MLYCVSCKKSTASKKMHSAETINGRPMVKATCVDCGMKKTSFKLMGGRTVPKQVRTEKKITKDLNYVQELADKLAGQRRTTRTLKKIEVLNRRMEKLRQELTKLGETE